MAEIDWVNLNWQPVILLKLARPPFGVPVSLSLKRAYLTLAQGQLLYADWTLEAAERAFPLVVPGGWTFPTEVPLILPLRLQGGGGHLLPSGTWVLPYTDRLFTLYAVGSAAITRIIQRIDQNPLDPAALAALIRLSQIL